MGVCKKKVEWAENTRDLSTNKEMKKKVIEF